MVNIGSLDFESGAERPDVTIRPVVIEMISSAWDIDTLSKLVEPFYLGFLRDDALLQSGLASLARQFGAESACLTMRHLDDGKLAFRYLHGAHFHDGVDYPLLSSYDSHFWRLDPYLMPLLQPESIGQSFCGSHRFEDISPEVTAYFQKWRKIGWRHILIGGFCNEDGRVGYVRFYRSAEMGPFAPEQAAKLNQVLPHLATSYRMRDAFSQVYAPLERILFNDDERVAGVVYFDSDGNIVMVNDTARQIFAAMDGLYYKAGRIIAGGWEGTQSIEKLISNAIACSRIPTSLPIKTSALITRPSNRSPYIIKIVPVLVQNRFTEQNAITVALRIVDPDIEEVGGLNSQIQAYELTAAEARLARYLVAGMPPKEVARQTGLSVHTIRTQQRGLYRKLGVSRHFDLLKRLSPGSIG